MIMDEPQDGRRVTAHFISIGSKGPHPALWGCTSIRVTQAPRSRNVEQDKGTQAGDSLEAAAPPFASVGKQRRG